MSKKPENKDDLKCLVGRLRSRFGLPETVCSDDDLLRYTEGTFGRAMVDMSIAIDGLWDAVRTALPTWLRWLVPPNGKDQTR